MAGGNANHIQAFSALRGGIAIHNPRSDDAVPGGAYGTLGFIATSDGTDRWAVSCYHVLCRRNGAMPDKAIEPIYHPFSQLQPAPIATITTQRSDSVLDCAAALVHDGVPSQAEILGIGRLAPPAEPVLGRRVLKAGAETGVTEGVIVNVFSDEIEIAPVFSASSNYLVSAGGDSGALWVDATSYEPLALHYRGSDRGFPQRAFGHKIQLILDTLKLRFL